MPKAVKTSSLALDILELVAFSSDPPSQTEVAATMNIAKSAAHKHLYTLQDRGYLVRDALTARYSLGPKAWLIGTKATVFGDLAVAAESHMRAARASTGLAVVLCSTSDATLRVIATLSGTRDIEIGVRQGSTLDLYTSAQGRVLFAFGAPHLRDAISQAKLLPVTPRTTISIKMLTKKIRKCRDRGYAEAPEETLLGVNALAAPIFGHNGKLVGTVALVGSIQHLKSPPGAEQIETICSIARAISQTQGYKPVTAVLNK